MKSFFNRRAVFVISIMCLLVLRISVCADEKSPIYEYKFNDSGVTAESTGTNNEPLLLYKGAERADIRTDGGFGVSGSLSDRALDCTKDSNGMWGWAVHEKDFDEIDGLKSFTLQGWYKLPERAYLTPGGRFFENEKDFRLTGWSTRLSFTVGGTNIRSESFHAHNNTEWTFFAVTFDSELAENNVHFYTGSKTEPVRLINSATINDIAPNSNWRLRIGAISGSDSPINVYLDNMRVFGSKDSNNGVLTIDELEKLRYGDVVVEADKAFTRIEVFPARCEVVTKNPQASVEIGVYLADSANSALAERNILLRKIGGDLGFNEMKAVTDTNGKASFMLSSRRAGKLILDVLVDSGTGSLISHGKAEIEFVDD